jgi:multiple sugar transport system substrate-binding protein
MKKIMLKNIDKILLVIALLVLATAFIFFPKEKIVLKKTEIVFSQWWEDEIEDGAFQALIAEFENENSGIEIKLARKSESQIQDDLNAILEGINPDEIKDDVFGDIYAINPSRFDEATIVGVFEDLDALGGEQEEDALLSGRTIPVVSFLNPLFYDITILQNAGFDRPPKTWEQFLSVCRKLKEKNESGFFVEQNYFDEFFPWVLMSGVDLSEPEKINYARSLELFKTLYDGALFTSVAATDKKIEDFSAGKIPMMITSSIAVDAIRKKNPALDFNVTSIPSFDDFGKNIFSATSWNVGIASSSKHKEEAMVFLKYLAAKRQDIAILLHALPTDGNRAVKPPGVDPKTDAIYAKVVDMYEASESIEAINVFKNGDWAEHIINEELRIMFAAERSPKETSAEIQKRLWAQSE